MKILITGGAGFIGANLTRHAEANGHDVAIIDNLTTGCAENLDGTNAALTVGDITDVATLTPLVAEVDAVVHLAARGSVPRSLEDPAATHVANVNGTFNVLEASRSTSRAHVIMASSSSVYGANPELPKHEGLAPRPVSPYAASKLAGETYTIAYGSSFELPTLAFRFFNVFGRLQTAGHAYAAVIPAFTDAALRGRPLTVHGDGTQSRDFTHVSTVTTTLLRAVEERVTCDKPVNLAFGTRTSLNEVIEALTDMVENPLVIENVESRAGDVAHSQADHSLLDSLMPGIEPVDFGTGLADTVAWMQSELADLPAEIVI